MDEVDTRRYKRLWMLKINWLMENSAQACACLFPSSYAPKKHIKKSGIVHYLILDIAKQVSDKTFEKHTGVHL